MNWSCKFRRLLPLVAASLLLATSAQAYYFYVIFNGRFGSGPIPFKFDLNALQNKTVFYFISDQGPSPLAPGDSFAAVISQIRLAGRQWNDVPSSDLRLAFGGLETFGSTQNTPGIDVVFDDDVPPGLAALGGITMPLNAASATISTASGVPFVPIMRSKLKLRRDLTQTPSFSEAFFTTLVHEFGHTLGLQHTFSSSVMSTSFTRSTSKAKPLGADDIAGISLLYPGAGFLSATGSITGRVAYSGGDGVNLASVVAISPSGPTISALSNPDGTYRIDAVPPGQYYVYAHPLPPPASGELTPGGLQYPVDASGKEIPVGSPFDTQFYPGTKDWNQASAVYVSAGASADSTNFYVNKRSATSLYAVSTYSFPSVAYPALALNAVAVKGAVLPVGASSAGVYVTGAGLFNSNGGLLSGVSATAIGGSARVLPGSVRAYSQNYLEVDLATFSGDGPRHMTFALNNDLYVLPGAFTLVHNPPPVVTAVTPAFDDKGNRAVTISGNTLQPDTRILFDGALAAQIRVNPDSSILVTPPPAASGYVANVVALNNDGQSSLYLQYPPPTYTYDGPAFDPNAALTSAAGIGVYPSTIPAGAEAAIDIQIQNGNFVDGEAKVGFGSSDIVVRRVWVLSPTHLVANVAVSANALPFSTQVSVSNGLSTFSQPFAIQLLPAFHNLTVISGPIVNAATGLTGTPVGGTAIANVLNLPSSTLTLTVAGQPATIVSSGNGQISFIVPPGVPNGGALVSLTDSSGDPIYPVMMNVDAPPPVITNVITGTNTAVDSNHPAHAGDLITLFVTGLADPGIAVLPSRLHINVGGVDHIATSINGRQVQFLLSPNVPQGNEPLTIMLDTRVSAPATIFVRNI